MARSPSESTALCCGPHGAPREPPSVKSTALDCCHCSRFPAEWPYDQHRSPPHPAPPATGRASSSPRRSRRWPGGTWPSRDRRPCRCGPSPGRSAWSRRPCTATSRAATTCSPRSSSMRTTRSVSGPRRPTATPGVAPPRLASLAVCEAVRAWALANAHEYALIYGSPVPGYAAPEATIVPASRVPLVLAAAARRRRRERRDRDGGVAGDDADDPFGLRATPPHRRARRARRGVVARPQRCGRRCSARSTSRCSVTCTTSFTTTTRSSPCRCAARAPSSSAPTDPAPKTAPTVGGVGAIVSAFHTRRGRIFDDRHHLGSRAGTAHHLLGRRVLHLDHAADQRLRGHLPQPRPGRRSPRRSG